MPYHVAAWYFNLLPVLQHSVQTVATSPPSMACDRWVMQHASPSSCEWCHCQRVSLQRELPARSPNFICQCYLINYALQKKLIELCTWKAANWSKKNTLLAAWDSVFPLAWKKMWLLSINIGIPQPDSAGMLGLCTVWISLPLLCHLSW